MSWVLTYAALSTVLASLVFRFEKKLRPDWRELAIWLSIVMPIVVASASLVEFPRSDIVAIGALAPDVKLVLPAEASVESGYGIARLAMLLWVTVSTALFIRDMNRRRRLLKVMKREPASYAGLQTLATSLGVERTLLLTQSDVLPVPLAIGSREICLPSSLIESSTPRDLEPILAHEIAHLRRQDPLLGQLARLIVVAFWWQPLNRGLADRLAAVAELRSDALTTSVIAPTRLANALVRFAQSASTPRIAGMPAFPSGLLSERVSSLLEDDPRATTLRWRLLVAAVFAFGALMLAPRFDVLTAQIPAALRPLVVNATPQTPSDPQPSPARPLQDRATAIQESQSLQPSEKEVVATLVRLLRDPEKHVRAAARESLVRIGSADSRAALRNDSYAAIDSEKEKQ